jgi:monoterpene epsilon-lactone hydrolase
MMAVRRRQEDSVPPLEPSAASRSIVASLWTRTPSRQLSLEEWRHAASAAERAELPSDLRHTTVEAAGVAAEWSWLRTDGHEHGPVVVVFHGGGWIVCSVGTHRVLGATVAAAAGGRALVVGYRRAPEHPFPAAVEDCAAAYQWLLESGVRPERVAFFGDSAGGNLCLTTSFLLRERGVPLPGALVMASPSVDLTTERSTNRDKDPFSRIDSPERVAEWYLAGADPTDPLVSPIYGEFEGLPPMLVMVGPDEQLHGDAVALVTRARSAGVDVTYAEVVGAFHTWLGYFGQLPEADASIAQIGDFLRRTLSPYATATPQAGG